MRRLVVLVVGAAVVLASAPAVAATRSSARGAEAEALTVLARAAQAGRVLDYSGTQYVASWHHSGTGGALADVTHRAGHGAVVREPPSAGGPAGPVAATAALHPRQVPLLAAGYDLSVTGTARCTGRTTSVVEARRDDGQVAGRFWVDRDTGLLLRREVYDDAGRRIRSSAFVDLDVRRAAAPAALRTDGESLHAEVADLRGHGWDVPTALPHGFRLFDTRVSTTGTGEHVVHLAYSDGLSTTSLFAQSGRLGSRPLEGFEADEVDGRPVWVRHASPERAVWSGGGRVWTLVSDAPDAAVRDLVAALPRDRAPDDGLAARFGRGLGRLGSWLNPFR